LKIEFLLIIFREKQTMDPAQLNRRVPTPLVLLNQKTIANEMEIEKLKRKNRKLKDKVKNLTNEFEDIRDQVKRLNRGNDDIKAFVMTYIINHPFNPRPVDNIPYEDDTNSDPS
jgi:molecular chaperone GrpE (heat shock protein)